MESDDPLPVSPILLKFSMGLSPLFLGEEFRHFIKVINALRALNTVRYTSSQNISSTVKGVEEIVRRKSNLISTKNYINFLKRKVRISNVVIQFIKGIAFISQEQSEIKVIRC